jgi:hypothetical protein
MIRYALLQNNVVVNVIDVDPDAQYPGTGHDEDNNPIVVMGAWVPPEGFAAVQSDTAQIGWTLNGTVFTDTTPPPPPLPTITAPTLSDLQTQLAAITAQINALATQH